MTQSTEEVLHAVRTPKKHGKLVVAPSFKRGDFHSHAVDCPFLFKHGERFGMTFVGWDGVGYQTGISWSDDLTVWEAPQLIIERGHNKWTETNIALTGMLRANRLFGSAELVRVDGSYIGTYHAYPGRGYEVGPAVIGLCRSEDLTTWEVSQPVLEPDRDHEWEAGGLYKSWILEHDGLFYLFYNAKNRDEKPWIEQTGFATSADLENWTRHEGNPVLPVGPAGSWDDLFASDPCVLRYGDTWLMFYYGYSSDGHARDGLAISTDLREWTKVDEILIDVGRPGSIDSKYAAKPALISSENRVFHFYGAVREARPEETGEIEHDEVRGITFAYGTVDTEALSI